MQLGFYKLDSFFFGALACFRPVNVEACDLSRKLETFTRLLTTGVSASFFPEAEKNVTFLDSD